MRWFFVLVLLSHGLIHLMGFVKAFGLAEIPQLSQPISRLYGVLWLLAALLIIAALLLTRLAPSLAWMVGALALLASQLLIFSSWSDAKFGTIANVFLLLFVVYGFFSQGPGSARALYQARVEEQLSRPATPGVITSADIDALPAPVAKYLRASGAEGQPRLFNFRARWRGAIRGAPDEAWMPFTAEQVSRLGPEPARLFLMDATRFGLPVEVLHSYTGSEATMRVKLASMVPVAEISGVEMSRAETVTVFNDLCLLAPAALVDPMIRWEAIDDKSARATFTNGPHQVSATLLFNERGELSNFISEDRQRASADGKQLTRLRWSTPVREYRAFEGRRAFTKGEARWHAPPPEGEFVYITLELLSLAYNVTNAQ